MKNKQVWRVERGFLNCDSATTKVEHMSFHVPRPAQAQSLFVNSHWLKVGQVKMYVTTDWTTTAQCGLRAFQHWIQDTDWKMKAPSSQEVFFMGL